MGCVAGKSKHATIWIQPYELPLPPHSPLPSSCLVNPFLCKFHICLKSFHVADTLCSTFASPRAPALELLRCIVTRKCSVKNSIFGTGGLHLHLHAQTCQLFGHCMHPLELYFCTARSAMHCYAMQLHLCRRAMFLLHIKRSPLKDYCYDNRSYCLILSDFFAWKLTLSKAHFV